MKKILKMNTFLILKNYKNTNGTASIEFSIIFPIFLLLIYGIMEFGRVLFTWGMLNFSAQEASRFAVVNYLATSDQIKEYAKSKFILIDENKIKSFTVTSEFNGNDLTKTVTIEIFYEFSPIVPIQWATITLVGHSRSILVEDNEDLEAFLNWPSTVFHD